jgi:hypothetical protein
MIIIIHSFIIIIIITDSYQHGADVGIILFAARSSPLFVLSWHAVGQQD